VRHLSPDSSITLFDYAAPDRKSNVDDDTDINLFIQFIFT